jgi:molybdopterin/thiamine biosynthesis adenylyltransferase
VIKLITGIGEPLIGRLLLYDALTSRFETIRYKAGKYKARRA